VKLLAEILIEKYYSELQYSNEATTYIHVGKKDILKLSRALYLVHSICYNCTMKTLKAFNNSYPAVCAYYNSPASLTAKPDVQTQGRTVDPMVAVSLHSCWLWTLKSKTQTSASFPLLTRCLRFVFLQKRILINHWTTNSKRANVLFTPYNYFFPQVKPIAFYKAKRKNVFMPDIEGIKTFK